VGIFPLELGKETTSELLTVDTDRSCQVAFALDVASRSVQETQQMGRDEFELRYSFPYAYKVKDEGGEVLFAQDGELRWNEGTRLFTNKAVGASGGQARIQTNMAKFDVPPPGRIRVEAIVKPDTQYGSEATKAEAKVYDDVSRHARSIIAGAVLILFGPLTMIVGFVLFLVGWAREASQRREES